MTFSVRQVLADADLKPFEFEDADGDKLTLPHAKTLTPNQGIRVFVHGELAEVFDELTPGIGKTLMNLPSFAVEALMHAWMEHSGIDPNEMGLGKLATSSPSSSSTPPRSRPTSRSGGSRSRR